MKKSIIVSVLMLLSIAVLASCGNNNQTTEVKPTAVKQLTHVDSAMLRMESLAQETYPNVEIKERQILFDDANLMLILVKGIDKTTRGYSDVKYFFYMSVNDPSNHKHLIVDTPYKPSIGDKNELLREQTRITRLSMSETKKEILYHTYEYLLSESAAIWILFLPNQYGIDF